MPYPFILNRLLATTLLFLPAIAPADELAGLVAAGEGLYNRHCSNCHAMSLRGSPHGSALVGPVFIDKWGQAKPGQLLAYTRQNMPPGGTDVLRNNELASVVAYILATNRKATDTGLPLLDMDGLVAAADGSAPTGDDGGWI
ncbi:MAG: cytochrome c, partial [Halioglobus sp.]